MTRSLLQHLALVAWLTTAAAAADAEFSAAALPALGTIETRNPTTRETTGLLLLDRTHVQVTIDDHLALTTIDQVFKNPSDQVLEGTFTFPLPTGASLSRFAMEVEGTLIEGEIVEKQRGRAIYEDIVRSMRDPALVEMTEGRLFKARIFPIPPRAEKRIVLAYAQELEASADGFVYHWPMRPDPRQGAAAGRIHVVVTATSALGYESIASSWTPAGAAPIEPAARVHFEHQPSEAPRQDLVVTLRERQSTAPHLTYAPPRRDESEGYFTLRTAPLATTTASTALPRDIVFLVDTSASVTREEVQVEIDVTLEALAALAPGDRALVLAFDLEAVPVGATQATLVEKAALDLRAIKDALVARGTLGGSDLSRALDAAAGALGAATSGRHRTIVLIGDGLATLGETEPQTLRERARATGAQILPIAVGSEHAHALLARIARETGGLLRVAIPGAPTAGIGTETIALAHPDAIARDLVATVRSTAGDALEIPLDPVRPGMALVVRGRCRGLPESLEFSITGKLGAAAIAERVSGATLARVTSPLLPRSWATHWIEDALTEPPSAALKAEIIRMSESYGVMTPYTVFLVLESESAYQRYQIARRTETAAASPASGEDHAGAPAEATERVRRLDDADDESELADENGRDSLARSDSDPGLADLPGDAAPEAPPAASPAPRPMEAPPLRAEEALDEASRQGAGGGGEGAAKSIAQLEALPTRRVTEAERAQLAIKVTLGQMQDRRLVATTDQQAIDAAFAAVDQAPRSRAARKQLGLALLAARRLDEAITWSKDWIAIDPRTTTPYLQLGRALGEYGQGAEALRAFTSLVDVRPGEALAHRELGRWLVNLGLFDEARRQFEHAVADRPDDPSGLQDLAQLAIAAGEYPRAVDLFASLSERTWPEPFTSVRDLALQQLGLLYLRLEGRARAASALEDATRWADRRRQIASEHFAPRDLKVLINWDTAGTDVDLWVTGPDGQKCYYQNRNTAMGGTLYADITTGFGPEIYYLDQASYGEYAIEAHYYSNHEADDTRLRALVVLFEGTPRQEIHEVDLVLEQKDDVALIARISLTPPLK